MITLDTLRANPQLRKGAGWRGVVTHCKRGHAYTRENTLIGMEGTRACRTCYNAAQVRRRRERREAQC